MLAGAVVAGAGLVRQLCDAPGPVARRVVWSRSETNRTLDLPAGAGTPPQQFAHHVHDTGWLPGGTVVPISGPLGGD